MSKYFDNLGIAIDGIKLNPQGVWIMPVITESNKELMFTSQKTTNDLEQLVTVQAKSPLMASGLKIGETTGISANQLATVEWVTWAIQGLTEGTAPELDLTKYNNNITLTNTLKTTVETLNTQINGTGADSIVNKITAIENTISTSQFAKLDSLLSDVVILWGGNAYGWDGEDD